MLAKYGGGKLPVGNFTLSGFLFAIPLVEAIHKAGKDLTREKVYEALNTCRTGTGRRCTGRAKTWVRRCTLQQ